MKTRNYFLFAATLVLITAVCLTATAQTRKGSQGLAFQLPPEPIFPSVTLNAIEVADGTLGIESLTKKETMFGYSFLGRTTGYLPGSFNLSMNCAPSKPSPDVPSEMSGGSWALSVYPTLKDGSMVYGGSLYGTVNSGKMNWDKTGTNADVYFVLNLDGGTKSWDHVSGYVTFTGTLTVDGKTEATTLNGDLVFTIVSRLR